MSLGYVVLLGYYAQIDQLSNNRCLHFGYTSEETIDCSVKRILGNTLQIDSGDHYTGIGKKVNTLNKSTHFCTPLVIAHDNTPND